ncbi:hypothetical protein TWF696_006985 [Orbilia brochopaga]
MASSHGTAEFPDAIRNALNTPAEPPKWPTGIQYESYRKYMYKIQKTFTDVVPLATRLSHGFDRDPSPTGVYAIDIGQYSPDPQDRSFSVQGHAPTATTPVAVDALLRTKAPSTKLRMLFITTKYQEKDPVLLESVATFYDLNPRVLQDHLLRAYYNSGWDSTGLSIHDTCLTYFPSEAHFSPITFERSIRTRRKRIVMMLVSNPSLDFPTVLVLILRSDGDCYSSLIVNRDILQPSMYTPQDSLGTWRHPQNEAETCYLRLSKLNSLELEACCSHPILTILPVVRSYCIETSQDIYQLKDHLVRFGLGNAGLDGRPMPNSKLENHWGFNSSNPFDAFRDVNSSYITAYRSFTDHLSFPWLDNRKPHREYADSAIGVTMADAQRVMEEVNELRDNLKESSAFILAKESIHEARRSVAQAESVTQLTRLAFVFIPLTFATSIFGMNIAEWQDDIPRLRWFIVTAVSCAAVTMISAVLVRKWAEAYRAWTEDHHGLLRACFHFVRDWAINIILQIFITLPAKVTTLNQRWARWREERKKPNMV